METRPYDKGAVLVDMNTGKCFRLNAVGAEVWTLMAEPQILHEVCLKVSQRYQTAIQQVTEDISDLVERLKRETLLVSESRAE